MKETLIIVRVEPCMTCFGSATVRIRRGHGEQFVIEGLKKIGQAERHLGEVGASIRRRRVIPAQRVEALLARLAQLQIPAFPVPEEGCDGEYLELEIGGYSGKALYRWWSEPPEAWRPLKRIAEEILAWAGVEEFLEC